MQRNKRAKSTNKVVSKKSNENTAKISEDAKKDFNSTSDTQDDELIATTKYSEVYGSPCESAYNSDDSSDNVINTDEIISPDDIRLQDKENELNENTIELVKRQVIYPDGYLKIITGCMFSGKTSYLIRECKKWQSIGKNVLMINYTHDRRYTDKDQVVSHDKNSVDCLMVEKITPRLDKMIESYDVVLINEAQFFPGIAKSVRNWVDIFKKIVVVSGLDSNYLRCKFGEITDLIYDCDDYVKLKAYCSTCRDGTEAIFTWKVVDNPIDSKAGVDIDIGTDKYVPLCRKHYNREIKSAETIKRK